jgi:hypothetical protein
VEHNPRIFEEIVGASDPVAWLIGHTGTPDEVASIKSLYVSLPKWCALPSVPKMDDSDLFAYQLKEAWINRFKRHSTTKFEDHWHTLIRSQEIGDVIRDCFPAWFSI